VARGDRVTVVDDFSTGHRRNLPDDVVVMEGDVADPALMRKAVEGADGCFHLAAIASVERGVTDWLGTHRTNLSGTITLFDALRSIGARVPVVYASSAAVYGDSSDAPITEEALCRPLSAYGADKLGCELHARVASVVHGIPTVGLRFFNVYGPRQDPSSPYSGVISIFCERIGRGLPIDIFGDGLQTRDFIYVDDVVNGLLGAMELPPSGWSVFNLCTGRATSISDLAQAIAAISGKELDPRYCLPRAGEVRHSIGVAGQARAKLGLHETTQLQHGLRRVLEWMSG
jgi:UDP-glucose 4-epimerase